MCGVLDLCDKYVGVNQELANLANIAIAENHAVLIYSSPKTLPLGNISFCFSFARFVREATHPPTVPTPLGRQCGPFICLTLRTHVSPTKILAQIKLCY